MDERMNDPKVQARLKNADDLLLSLSEDARAALAAGIGDHSARKSLVYAQELAKRKMDALRLYKPTKIQDAYHACTAKECMFQAGNQVGKALSNDEPVLTPNGWVAIGELKVGDMVYDGLGNLCRVTGVFPQGEVDLYSMVFDDGASVRCCGEHLWKVKITKRQRFNGGDWGICSTRQLIDRGGMRPVPMKRAMIPVAVVQMARKAIPLDPYLVGCLIGDGSLSGASVEITTADKDLASSLVVPFEHEVRKKKSGKYAYTLSTTAGTYGTRNHTHSRKNKILQSLRSLGLWGCKSEAKFIPNCYLFNSVKVRLQVLRGLMDTDGSVTKTGCCEYCTTSPQLAKDVEHLVRSLGGKCKTSWRTTQYTNKHGERVDGKPSARMRIRMWCANPFQLARKALRWKRPISRQDGRFLYEINPCGRGLATCITVDSADRTFVTRNFVVTHNSLAGFAEDARALRGEDPYNKYPKKDGLAAVIGYKERHIGLVVYKYLFMPGAFDIIRDEETLQWRVFRPWVPQDMARIKEKIMAPPLIPQRFVEKFAWKNKAESIFSEVTLTTGWKLFAFSSTSKPDQGFQLDLAHIDEDIINEDWYSELAGRTTMRNGLLRWTALPHNENDMMNTVAERAEDEAQDYAKGGPKPKTVLIHATVFDNPFMPESAREANIKIWKSKGEAEYRKRALGERITDSVRMYPTFNRHVHAVQNYAGKLNGLFDEYLKTKIIPDDWCCDFILDPGHAVLAVLLFATPPPILGNFKLAYKELYLLQCDAKKFGDNIEQVARNHWFQRFIIDSHGGALTSFDTGRTPQEAYEEQLHERNISCVATGSTFMRGCDAVEFRETRLREWLVMQKCGAPILLYDSDECTNFEREMIRFKKMKIGDNIIDKGNRRANTHLVECCEYAAAHELEYESPPSRRKNLTAAQRWLADFKDRQKVRTAKQRGLTGRGSNILLGPQGVR
jgi:hypothetical protein